MKRAIYITFLSCIIAAGLSIDVAAQSKQKQSKRPQETQKRSSQARSVPAKPRGLVSKKPLPGKQQFKSPNGRYKITVEVPRSKAAQPTFEMTTDRDQLLWKKQLPYEKHPVVSNKGEAVLYLDGGMFIDRSGNEVGRHQSTDHASLPFSSSTDTWSNPYVYAMDGQSVYSLIEEPAGNELSLAAINADGKEQWRVRLTDLRVSGSKTTPNSILPMREGILLHNFTRVIPGRRHRCYLISNEGRLIARFEADFRQVHPPVVDNETGEFMLYDGKKVNIYNQENGQKTGILQPEAVARFIYSHDDEAVYLGLSILYTNPAYENLILEHLEQIEKLSRGREGRISNFSKIILSKLYTRR